MMKQIAVAAVALLSVASGALANTILSETASPIAKITQGHAAPGDTASSVSDPNVSGTRPPATAAALPPDEPPAMRVVSCGLRHAP